MRHICFSLILFISCISLPSLAQDKPSRIPAYPSIIEKVQPNGDTLHIRLVGDERKHWTTTEDGYKIALNKRGYYCYVSNERTTCRKAHDANQRRPCERHWLEKRSNR